MATKYCSAEYCAICEYHEKFSKIRFSNFNNSPVSKEIKRFYQRLNKELDIKRKEHLKKSKRKGDRNFISKTFQNVLLETIKTITKNVKEEQNLLNDDYSQILKSKKVDIFISDNTKIAIEIKSTITFNDIGAAFLESLVTKGKYDKFFILGLSTYPHKEDSYKIFRKLVTETELSKTITDLVVFDPELKDYEKGVENFFKVIKDLKSKTKNNRKPRRH